MPARQLSDRWPGRKMSPRPSKEQRPARLWSISNLAAVTRFEVAGLLRSKGAPFVWCYGMRPRKHSAQFTDLRRLQSQCLSERRRVARYVAAHGLEDCFWRQADTAPTTPIDRPWIRRLTVPSRSGRAHLHVERILLRSNCRKAWLGGAAPQPMRATKRSRNPRSTTGPDADRQAPRPDPLRRR